jgi:hypothetical protein
LSANPTKFNILFSGSLGADVVNLCRYIDEFAATVGLSHLDINTSAITGVIAVTNQQFPWTHGAEKASPFKKVAAFTTNFVAEKPIITPFPENKFGILGTHQNAIIAYALSVDALEGAIIKCDKRKKDIPLTNRIKISQHYWQDLIVALSGCSPAHHFNCVSLIYESLAYRANPDVSYDQTI